MLSCRGRMGEGKGEGVERGGEVWEGVPTRQSMDEYKCQLDGHSQQDRGTVSPRDSQESQRANKPHKKTVTLTRLRARC